MVLLYVYTTLPLNSIVRVIHPHQPATNIGIDSANKKLKALLYKEPRWLRPRNERDMGRRVAQLSNSLTRLKLAEIATSDASSLPSDGTSRYSFSPARVKEKEIESSEPADRLPFDAPAAFSPEHDRFEGPRLLPNDVDTSRVSPGLEVATDTFAEEMEDSDVFSSFLRRTTSLSASSGTGSFRHILSGYSGSYIQTVERLVKGFGALRNNRSGMQEEVEALLTRLDNDDAPRAFDSKHYPLPGDFLFLDRDLFTPRQLCLVPTGDHDSRRCLCFNQFDDYSSPWVTTEGITPTGRRLLDAGGPTNLEVFNSDSAGNTALHFLAARGSLTLLLRVVESGRYAPILNARNTGGQTFLHVLNQDDIQGHLVFQLLRAIVAQGFDICARDIYGRSCFHILHIAELPLDRSEIRRLIARDAFGVRHTIQHWLVDIETQSVDRSGTSSEAMLSFDPAIMAEAQLLEHIRLAVDDPFLEFKNGGNGLHSVAMATLSPGSLVRKYGLDLPEEEWPDRRRRIGQHAGSGGTDLRFRHSLAQSLLDAGLDPNHYDLNGNTPLMLFAANLPEDEDYETGPKILDKLVQRGAKVDARNRSGETALHIAVRFGRKLAVRELVKHGANVYAKEAEGRSVLDVADIKMVSSGGNPRDYAQYEACRAWLSSDKVLAVQNPTIIDEWGRR
ncbi:ankyrin repeats (many copies) domain-containing protein [Hirsutella rhossiliensis]|uniref:Ankyrin repeats (Many copies) domain-containing protein n=1 Tax=Hirsutella rhossiliensis TaxID=111463 RepID=A0A9P8SI26_9HYPO|nr:ankyrin repeats (many copies) domain-containing protein [Hirsutella rhossiliensis]KAH0963436.1 ankyrin repeats (many copies) domain-containing protein [Hirsutella rhossiliensis]